MQDNFKNDVFFENPHHYSSNSLRQLTVLDKYARDSFDDRNAGESDFWTGFLLWGMESPH